MHGGRTHIVTHPPTQQIDAALQQNLANQLQHIAMLTHHALLSLHDHRAEQHQAMLDQATQRQEDTAAAPRVGGLAFAVGNGMACFCRECVVVDDVLLTMRVTMCVFMWLGVTAVYSPNNPCKHHEC